jgi:hypothetical protein
VAPPVPLRMVGEGFSGKDGNFKLKLKEKLI